MKIIIGIFVCLLLTSFISDTVQVDQRIERTAIVELNNSEDTLVWYQFPEFDFYLAIHKDEFPKMDTVSQDPMTGRKLYKQ